jgi:hypothetical protein
MEQAGAMSQVQLVRGCHAWIWLAQLTGGLWELMGYIVGKKLLVFLLLALLL